MEKHVANIGRELKMLGLSAEDVELRVTHDAFQRLLSAVQSHAMLTGFHSKPFPEITRFQFMGLRFVDADRDRP